MRLPCFLSALGVAAACVSAAAADFTNFITARGDQLMDGAQPFRFISWDIPNLQLIEDNCVFTNTNPWRLPDRFELTDALATVNQLGGLVTRIYVISVKRADDGPGVPRHVLGVGKFNEDAFHALDEAIQVAHEQGVRLIIPLVDNWVWQGGRAEYAAWRGKTKDDFWTDPQLWQDFQQTIRYVINRTNTLTGIRYADDKAILCWETGNEVRCPVSWTRKVAAYIKSLDANHLVLDGYDAGIRPEVLAMPEVDIVTTHQYPGNNKKSFAQQILDNAALTKGKKPYIVGEFGFGSTAQMTDAIRAIRDSNAVGGMLWSLRFHDRDGGYYWHSEGAGGNLYKAFHWPGSPIADAYDERKLMAIVRGNAFGIRGLPLPSAPIPAPPTLLPVTDAAALSWQGSVGASVYRVERASQPGGPWEVLSSNVDECFTQYHPEFADESAPRGTWYYRVLAQNDSGISKPSNVSEPVIVTHASLVDELADFSRVDNKTGSWEIKTRDTRKAKEDAHRAAGNSGDALVYKLPTALESFRVFVFFPKEVADIKFSASTDGINFHPIAAARDDYFQGAGDYDYWKPSLYHAENPNGKDQYLKIELTGETQISRIEIARALPGN